MVTRAGVSMREMDMPKQFAVQDSNGPSLEFEGDLVADEVHCEAGQITVHRTVDGGLT
jgi:hypothetical protein